MKHISILLVSLFAALAYAADKPNVLFILTDDQRHDSLSCYGHPIFQTPVIDGLAKEGIRFENAFVTTSICAASRASILTGLYETTHGYTFGKKPVPEQAFSHSYPALLRANGYKTGFSGKFGVRIDNQRQQQNNSFDVFSARMRPFMVKQKDGSKKHIDEIVGDTAIDMIRKFKSGPFCVSVSFASTHADDGNHKPGMGHFPYPASAKDLYADVTFPAPKHKADSYINTLPDFLTDKGKSMGRYRYHWRWDTPEKYQANMQAYARMTTGIDTIVGRMINELKAQGLYDNTIIIYSADNGFYLGNRKMAGKWSHFEESLRVPLIIRDPRVKKAGVRDQMVLNIDIPATILDLAGVAVPAHYQGGSLASMLNDPSQKIRDSFFCEHRMGNPRIAKWQGLRGQRYTYANYYENKYEFLHDLQKDPHQLTNLADNPEYATILKDMRAKTETLDATYRKNPVARTPKK